MNRLFARVVVVSILMSTGFVFAEDKAPEKPWKNVTEGSMVSANGNSNAFTASGKNTFTYTKNKFALELIGGAMGAESEGTHTAEKYNASEKGTFKFSEKNYAYEKYGWDKDRFAGIKDRHDASVGAGRELVKKIKHLLIGELGVGHIIEDRIGEENNSFDSGRGYSKYTFTMSETASFSQDAEYIHNFENPDDFRVNTETALLSTLSTHLSLKVSYVWKHVGVPPAGFRRNDTTTSVSLVATY